MYEGMDFYENTKFTFMFELRFEPESPRFKDCCSISNNVDKANYKMFKKKCKTFDGHISNSFPLFYIYRIGP